MNVKTLIIPSKFNIRHSLHLLYHFKQKVIAKQEQYKNYYSFTLLLHDEQNAQDIMNKFKSDLKKIDNNAFALFFEAENRDSADTIFSTSNHKGIRHIHGLIFTDKEIDILDIKNSQARSNKLKHKSEYKIQDATRLIDYIFHNHQIFKIFYYQFKAIKPIKLAIFSIYSNCTSFNFPQIKQKPFKNGTDSKIISTFRVKKPSKFAVFFASTTNMCLKFFILTYKGKAVKKYAIY